MLDKNSFFIKEIYSWFLKNQRNLPFRNTKNPYKIWIAEIMLQQTRMGSVLNQFENKYAKFIERFPDIQSLAESNLEEVLHYWSGLGYYHRAKNLYITSKILLEKYNGNFPINYKELIELPGIGDYTASAILSIAFDLPYSVFDGNVNRVLSRFFYHTLKPYQITKVKHYAQHLIKELKGKPSIYNQALMEYGALICTPKPKCNLCLISKQCDVFSLSPQEISEIPPRKIKKKQELVFFVYIIKKNNKILIQKSKEGILKNHYFFPYIEVKNFPNSELSLQENKIFLGIIPHSIMHYKIKAYVFITENLKNDLSNLNLDKNENQWIEISKIQNYLYTNFAKKIFRLYILKNKELYFKW